MAEHTDANDILTAEQECEKITEAMEGLDKDDEVCLIVKKWWTSWCSYSGYGIAAGGDESAEAGGATRPGALDNSELCNPEFNLAINPDASEAYDFEYVTVKAFQLLKKWYGGGKHDFKRRRVMDPNRKRKIIQLNPFFIRIARIDSITGKVTKANCKYESFDRAKTFAEIFMAEREKLGRDQRMWVPFRIANASNDFKKEQIPKGFDNNKLVELTRESNIWDFKLEDVNIEQGDTFQFEVIGKDNKWSSSKAFSYDDIGFGFVGEGFDKYGKWYHMQIIGTREKNQGVEYHCHWLGFKSSWNEWIPESDREEKMDPIGKHCKIGDQKWYPKTVPAKKPTSMTQFKTNHTTSSTSSGGGYRVGTSYSSSSSTNYSRSNYYSHQAGSSAARGICGLRNLGNTCFMNSVIQCVNQSPFINEYFLKDKYKQDLNLDNPLGHKGEVANKWADLMKDLWCQKYKVVVPIDFKKVIGQFAPQFMGFQQQDSQELLSFLLDGVHEDLNRIVDKPYIPGIEAGDRDLREVAQEAWDNHKKRNSSVIVDNFHGQLKSRVECPECDRVSITFDPYSNISTPIPTDNQKTQIITFIPHNAPENFVPVAYGVKIAKSATIRQLKQVIIDQLKLTNVDPNSLHICDVYKGKLQKLKKDHEPVNRMHNPVQDDFFVYECLPFNMPQTLPDGHKPQVLTIPLCHRKPGMYDARFGIPLALVVDNNSPYDKDTLNEYICRLVTPYLSESCKAKLKEDPELNIMSLFEIKYLEKTPNRMGTSHFVSFTPKKWENMKDLSLVDTIQLCWKEQEDYNETYSNWRTRRRDKSAQTSKKTAIDLGSCFDCFTQTETLKDDNLWYCSSCKKHREAKKTMSIWTCPNILIIHLKRFSYTRWSRSKISALIKFPLDGLDISGWIENPDVSKNDCIYDCFGVSNHSGSLGGGHYTAAVKNREDGKWYCCNDSSCYEINKEKVISSEAYLLFYRRRDWTPEHEPPRDMDYETPNVD